MSGHAVVRTVYVKMSHSRTRMVQGNRIRNDLIFYYSLVTADTRNSTAQLTREYIQKKYIYIYKKLKIYGGKKQKKKKLLPPLYSRLGSPSSLPWIFYTPGKYDFRAEG